MFKVKLKAAIFLNTSFVFTNHRPRQCSATFIVDWILFKSDITLETRYSLNYNSDFTNNQYLGHYPILQCFH